MTTRRLRYALLGQSVRHSPSPVMHLAAMKALDLPHGYTAVDIPSQGSLRRMVEEIRRKTIAGANITSPYKRLAYELADRHSPLAEEVGAANVLMLGLDGKVFADNTDVEAIESVISSYDAPRSRAAVIGAGGAALAAIIACRRLGFSVVSVTSRSWRDTETTFESEAAERVRGLGALTSPWPDEEAIEPTGKASMVMRLHWTEMAEQADFIIQASSAGSPAATPPPKDSRQSGPPSGGPSIRSKPRSPDESGEVVAALVPWAKLRPHAVALDLVYGAVETPFVKAARAHGITGEDGLQMLVRQAELSFVRWLECKPPPGIMEKAARDALAAVAAGGAKAK